MAFALAMQNTMSEARQMFLTTTSLISIFTVIFCGGMTSPLLTFLKVRNYCMMLFQFLPLQIPTGVPDAYVEDPESCNEEDQTPSLTLATPGAKSALARGWKKVDAVLLKPLLTNSQPTLEETLPWLGPIARMLTPCDQMTGTHISR